MGRFFTNVHVRLADDGARAAVRAALERRARADGLVPVEPGEEAERLTSIGPADSPWTTVADEATDSQDLEELERLASELSKEVDDYALSVLVHDSDVLDLGLFAKGRRLDHYVNRPDYFSARKLSAKKRKAVEGRASRWAPVLAAGATVDDLQTAFRTDQRSAEAALAAIARLIGLPDGYDLGARDLLELSPAGVEHRFFGRAASAREPSRPPKLEPASHTTTTALSAGDALHWAASALNRGGRCTGVEIAIAGSALDRNLVELERAICAVPLPRGQMIRMAVDLAVADGRATATFPALRVPQAGPLLAAPQVLVSLQGKAIGEGHGRLQLQIAPIAFPAAKISQAIDLKIGPALKRPLKAVENANAGGSLAALQSPVTLVALVALGVPKREAAALCATAMANWIRVLCGRSRATFSTITYGSGSPERGRLKSNDVPRDLAATLAESGAFFAQTRVDLKAPGAADSVMAPTHGMGFQLGLIDVLRDPSPIAPHAAFWCDIRALSPGDAGPIAAALTEIVDELMRQGRGHQAFLARWDWRPALAFQATPYELACGVHGQCTNYHEWVERFLHAVGDVIWLGPGLRSRVTPEALARLGSLSVVGDGVRLDRSAEVPELENALAAILPTHEDWRQASAAGTSLIDPAKLGARFRR
jgi:hypothetical protein